MKLTTGSSGGGRRLNRWSIPTLDGVKDAFFFFAAGGEPSDLVVGDYGLPCARIDDSGEDRTPVAA